LNLLSMPTRLLRVSLSMMQHPNSAIY